MGFKSKYDAGGKPTAERYDVFKDAINQLSMLNLVGEDTAPLKFDVDKNQFCFPADNESGPFAIENDIGYKASYVFADPRFLAGETDEKSSSFYKVDIKDGKQTVKSISMNEMVSIYDPTLKGMEMSATYEIKKNMVLMNHFGFDSLKAKIQNDVREKGWPYKSGNMRKDFDDFVKFTSDASDDFFKSIDMKYGPANDLNFGAGLAAASGLKGRLPDQLKAEKYLFVDPRVANGTIPPEQGEFYFVSTNPMTTKFEKATLDDVIAFEKSEPAIEKPRRGFWGTLRDRLFGKNNPGRRKYEREKEVYTAKKYAAIEKKFDIKGLEYFDKLTDPAFAEKYIKDEMAATGKVYEYKVNLIKKRKEAAEVKQQPKNEPKVQQPKAQPQAEKVSEKVEEKAKVTETEVKKAVPSVRELRESKPLDILDSVPFDKNNAAAQRGYDAIGYYLSVNTDLKTPESHSIAVFLHELKNADENTAKTYRKECVRLFETVGRKIPENKDVSLDEQCNAVVNTVNNIKPDVNKDGKVTANQLTAGEEKEFTLFNK